MHLLGLIILLCIVLLIVFNRETFIASYDMMINRSRNPIWARYNGRDKNPWGEDYYELFLKHQLSGEYSISSENMNFLT